MSTTIVVPRSRGPVVGRLAIGVMLTAIGLFFAFAGALPFVAAALFLVAGAPVMVASLRLLVTRAPRLRADERGLWFGGGSIVSWDDVDAIYESSFDVQYNGRRARTSAVAIDFTRRGTLFRLPISSWLASPFGVGDVDVSPDAYPGSTAALVARLDAMRVAAVYEAA
jgi:hypothetical protein